MQFGGGNPFGGFAGGMDIQDIMRMMAEQQAAGGGGGEDIFGSFFGVRSGKPVDLLGGQIGSLRPQPNVGHGALIVLQAKIQQAPNPFIPHSGAWR